MVFISMAACDVVDEHRAGIEVTRRAPAGGGRRVLVVHESRAAQYGRQV